VVPAGETAAALRPLPIAALRLNGETIAGLTRLGFDRISPTFATRLRFREFCGSAVIASA
jgi:hypothetical protein